MDNPLKGKGPLVVPVRQDASLNSDAITSATHPILIINNDPDALKVMACRLEDAGYTVVGVTSGSEALQWIQAAGVVSELPALILFDLALPGKDRSQMAEAMRQLGGSGAEPIMVTSVMQLNRSKNLFRFVR